MSARRFLSGVAFVVTLTFGFSGCGLPPLETGDTGKTSLPPEEARVSCRVSRVFDGDTLACDLNGDGRYQKPRETIRLLGIDAPETRHSQKLRRRHPHMKTLIDEPYAAQAATALKGLTQGKMLWLAFDVQRADRYGRTLAVAYLNASSDASVNEALLRAGMAKTLFLAPNFAYARPFRSAQAEAQSAGKGLWAVASSPPRA